MRVFVAILTLAAAACASDIMEKSADTVAAMAAPMAAEAKDALAKDALADSEMRTFALFDGPMTTREAIRDEEIPFAELKRADIKAIFDKPVVVLFKNINENKLDAFVVNKGLKSMYTTPEFAFMREALLSGPTKVGLTMKAVRALDLPELKLSMSALKLPASFNLHDAALFREELDSSAEWLLVTEKSGLRDGSLEKLTPIGEFAVSADKLKVLRDLSAAAVPVAVLPTSRAFALYRDATPDTARVVPYVLKAGHKLVDAADLGVERMEHVERPAVYRLVAPERSSSGLTAYRYEPEQSIRGYPATSIRSQPASRRPAAAVYRELDSAAEYVPRAYYAPASSAYSYLP